MSAQTKERKPTTDQLCELMAQIKSGRINRRHIQEFLRSPDKLVHWEDDAEFRIVVGYNWMTIEDMVEMGNYDHKSCSCEISHITFPPNSPCEERMRLDYRLVLRRISLKDGVESVIESLEKENLFPARAEHLLVFGAKYHDIQLKFPIIEVGTTFEKTAGGDVLVLRLDQSNGERLLKTHSMTFEPENDEIRVLAIRPAM